ncbi:hypothetical protein [Bacillus mycoides]|uniref:hypothetical protein n=1 Tax=Bacillus mycoides TaxID=1405 RepID=UPI003A7F7B5B
MGTSFYEGLGMFGWVAVAIRVALILSIFMKSNWWFNFEERMPRFTMFEDYLYTEVRIFVFMGLRLVVVFCGIWVFTNLLILIG